MSSSSSVRWLRANASAARWMAGCDDRSDRPDRTHKEIDHARY
jgi:hypothetical protein